MTKAREPPTGKPPTRGTTVRKTRAQKNAENQLALLHAAAEVVGEVGYLEASIARIIEKAGLSNGTFYLHFQSRQDILDQLLPFVGQEIFDFLHERVAGASSFLDVEECGIRGYFEYVDEHPSYIRVLTEAEVFAPSAWQAHIESAMRHFVESLKRSLKSGELRGYALADLEVIARVLLAARPHLVQLAKARGRNKQARERLISSYIKFIREGLASR